MVEARRHHLGTGPRPLGSDRQPHGAAVEHDVSPRLGASDDGAGELGRGHDTGALRHTGSRPHRRRRTSHWPGDHTVPAGDRAHAHDPALPHERPDRAGRQAGQG